MHSTPSDAFSTAILAFLGFSGALHVRSESQTHVGISIILNWSNGETFFLSLHSASVAFESTSHNPFSLFNLAGNLGLRFELATVLRQRAETLYKSVSTPKKPPQLEHEYLYFNGQGLLPQIGWNE